MGIYFAFYFERLETLANSDAPSDTTSFHFLRLKGYQLIEAAEFSRALEVLLKLRKLAHSAGRVRDYGSLTSATLFVLLKLGLTDRAAEELSKAFYLPLSPRDSALLLEWRLLVETPFMYSMDAMRAIKGWKQKGFTTTNFLFLVNVLAQKCMRARDYATAVGLCEMGEAAAVKGQQLPVLFNFWPMHIEALWVLHRFERAQEILESVTEPPNASAGEKRQAIIQDLRRRLDSALASKAGFENAATLRLDHARHILWVSRRQIPLGSTPVIERFFKCLLESSGGLAIDALFERVYGQPFDPSRHAHRFHSLLSRARKLLDDPSLLECRDATISFADRVRLPVFDRSRRSFGIEQRNTSLIRILKEASTPLSISQLEPAFSCTRRTLQHNLKQLQSINVVVASGATRNRKYRFSQGGVV